MPNESEILHVGIDLGTSRSAISASNGERFVVDSFVGWPADMVAKKVLKRDVLIGHEAVANRTMLDLHRPLERGLLKEGSEKDVEAVRELLKHLLRLVGVSSNGKIDALERARGGRRPGGGAAHEQAVPAQLDEGNRRQPDDRQRAVRGRLRPRRAAAHDDHRHRRRHDRLLRDEGPLSRPRKTSARSPSPATRSTRSSSS